MTVITFYFKTLVSELSIATTRLAYVSIIVNVI